MKKTWLLMCICGLCIAGCGEDSASDDGVTTEKSGSGLQGKGDVIVEGEADPEEHFGNFEVTGEIAAVGIALLQQKELFLGDLEQGIGEAEGVSCFSIVGESSCGFKTTNVEISGGTLTDYTIWMEGEGAETLYTWMSELAEQDERIESGVLARGDEYTFGNVSCSWSSGQAPGCFVIVGNEELVTRSEEIAARANEGFFALNGVLAGGIGALLIEAGRVSEMPKIDLKVGEAKGVRCSYDLSDVPMCELDASHVAFDSGRLIQIKGDVAVELYTLMDEVESEGSEIVTRSPLASGESMEMQGLSCSWSSGQEPVCIID